MIMVVLLALFVPIACVLLAYKSFTKPPPKDVPVDALQTMRQALETTAGRQLAQPTLGPGEESVHLDTPDPTAAAREIRRIAEALGGFAVISSQSERTLEILAQVPENRVSAFVTTCQGGTAATPSDPAGSESRIVRVYLSPRSK